MTWIATAFIVIWVVVILGTILKTIMNSVDDHGCGATFGCLFLIAIFIAAVFLAHHLLLIHHFFG